MQDNQHTETLIRSAGVFNDMVADSEFLRFNGNGKVIFTGKDTKSVNGLATNLFIRNETGEDLVVKHDSTASLSGNRMYITGGKDLLIPDKGMATFRHSKELGVWALSGVLGNGSVKGIDPDYYLNRANHTGTQAINTITGLQDALDAKIPLSQKGQPNGIATLGADGKIVSTQMPTPPVQSVFGRTGAVTAQDGDYNFSQIGSKPTTIFGYGITDAYTKTETDSITSQLIPLSQKGAADGVATLGPDSKIINSQIPAIALTDTFVVASQTEMLSLSAAGRGDVAIRTDENKSYILSNDDPTLLTNWKELLSPTVANTDQVPEGSTNLYFTDARARSALSAGSGISYNPATGVITNNFTETDPVFSASPASGITLGNIATWNSALQSGDNISLLNNDAGYLTSYSESDTLQSVTDRGNTTTNSLTIGALVCTFLNSDNPGAGSQTNSFGSNVSGNVGLEVGSETTPSSSFIDFHSSGNNIDYDTRIIAYGGNTASGNGTLNFIGNIQANGSTVATTNQIPTNNTQLSNGRGYITGESDTLQSVTDRGNSAIRDITVDGAIRSTGADNPSAFTSGVGLELRYLLGEGQILAYDRINGLYRPLRLQGASNSSTPHYIRIDSDGALANTKITATSFYESSSRKLKKYIKDFKDSATDLLKEVQVREFEFKKDKSRTKHVGIIAEDEHEYFATKEHDKFDLASTVAILIKGFQELENRVTKMEATL